MNGIRLNFVENYQRLLENKLAEAKNKQEKVQMKQQELMSKIQRVEVMQEQLQKSVQLCFSLLHYWQPNMMKEEEDHWDFLNQILTKMKTLQNRVSTVFKISFASLF